MKKARKVYMLADDTILMNGDLVQISTDTNIGVGCIKDMSEEFIRIRLSDSHNDMCVLFEDIITLDKLS